MNLKDSTFEESGYVSGIFPIFSYTLIKSITPLVNGRRVILPGMLVRSLSLEILDDAHAFGQLFVLATRLGLHTSECSLDTNRYCVDGLRYSCRSFCVRISYCDGI